MKPLHVAASLALTALVGSATPARADSAPDSFVTPDECQALSMPCKCADGPMMELFLSDQNKALDAWEGTKDAILTPGGPQTQAEAVADFHTRFDADPRVADQFTSCPDFDAATNTATKIAGVSLDKGGAALDPCFCQMFCQDITAATARHENVHFGFGFVALAELVGVTLACAAADLPAGFCDTLDAQLLADSEIFAHQAGTAMLQDSLDQLRMSDPDSPEMECTWEPLPALALRVMPPPPPAPAGFWQRVEMLASRFIHGASGSAS